MGPCTAGVEELARRFHTLHEDVLAFVRTCRPENWGRITAEEGWPVGVTARHIAVAHYPVIEWVQMIVQGDPLPPVTQDTLEQLDAQHAAVHGDCIQQEVAGLLRINHAKVAGYLQTIGDQDLAQRAEFSLFGREISARELFTTILIDKAGAHLVSIQATVAP